MTTDWGGNRPPIAPAPVSGPGALARRTDGNDPAYGDGIDLQNLKAGAPMAGTRAADQAQAVPPSALDAMNALTSLGAGSSQPNVPVTAGAARGAGPGVEALGLPQTPAALQRADAQAMSPGQVQALIAQAESADATPSFRQMVRQILYS